MRWFVFVLIVGAATVWIACRVIDFGLDTVDEVRATSSESRERARLVDAETGASSLPATPQRSVPSALPEPPLPPPVAAPLPSRAAVAPAPRPAPVAAPMPAAPPTPLIPPKPKPPYTGPTFTVGSSIHEVESIQGEPTGRSELSGDRQCRWWGNAMVQFRHGLVESWQDADGVLHVRAPSVSTPRVVD